MLALAEVDRLQVNAAASSIVFACETNTLHYLDDLSDKNWMKKKEKEAHVVICIKCLSTSLVYLTRSQTAENGERGGAGPWLRSGLSPSGVKCSESEPSSDGLPPWSDRPLGVFPEGCSSSQPSLLLLLDLRPHGWNRTDKLSADHSDWMLPVLLLRQLSIAVLLSSLSNLLHDVR